MCVRAKFYIRAFRQIVIEPALWMMIQLKMYTQSYSTPRRVGKHATASSWAELEPVILQFLWNANIAEMEGYMSLEIGDDMLEMEPQSRVVVWH